MAGFGDLPVVVVVWEDACSLHGWHGSAELQEFYSQCPLACMTSGFLVSDTEDSLFVTQSISRGDESDINTVGDTICIPKTYIKTAHILTVKGAKRIHRRVK